jgi:hypothetical protein
MKLFRLVISLFLLSAASSSFAAVVLYTEAADKVRFEQYTAGDAPLVLWRLPYPGSSTFPLDSNGTPGTCTAIALPATNTTLGNRFLSLYMFVKTNGSTYFVQYDTSTCNIISFGMDG